MTAPGPTLVLQAHPREDSYSAALLESVIAGVQSPRVVRLGHGDRFTVLSAAGCTELVAVYPTWWGSPPAVLLAALNDVIGPWVDGPQPRSTSPLALVQSLRVVTSHGSSRLVNRLQGEPGLQLWKRTVLPLCAPGATFRWQSLYKLDRVSDVARASFLTAVRFGQQP